MMRQFPLPASVLLAVLLTLATGCRPQQPFYFFEDGDLSHYIGVATEIDYPDVETCSLDEVNGAMPPLTLDNPKPEDLWELPLEEAMQIALRNSKVMKNLGGIVFGATTSQGAPTTLTSQPDLIPTIYGPAQQETDPSSRGGVEQALSAFDAQLSSSLLWQKEDRQVNSFNVAGLQDIFPSTNRGDSAAFTAEINKTAATGGTWAIRHNVDYSLERDVDRIFTSDWTVNVEAEFRQPLLQGAGVMYNRIAGPGAIPGFYNGVIIARLRTDQSLADFEVAVRDLAYNVERAYWELYYAYRSLEAAKAGRDAVLQLWRERKAEEDVGKGGRSEEAQARQQYFLFRSAAERAQSNLFRTENALRYLLGIAATDGRLIRPCDEPTTAEVDFDWYESHAEALTRSVALRKQKWTVKEREMELLAAKNYLLPRLDAVAQYRWSGLGDILDDPTNNKSNAYGELTSGRYQEWQFGLNLDLPIGFRKELAGVRHAQLNLARDRAVLQEAELEVSHQLSNAYRDLDENYVISQTNFNRRVAALDELETVKSKYEYGQRDVTFAMVLDAQRRLAEAEIDYYRAVVDYNLGISNFHRRKGSLLEYNGICLSEGPWPGKAYFDAHRLARARDASLYLDYGFTRPNVLSRGEYNQNAGGAPLGDGSLAPMPPGPAEVIPTPDPLPMQDGGMPTPAPAASGGGPALGGPDLSGGPASGKAGVLDVGKLDLSPLASKKAAAGSRPASSGVQPASFVAPQTGTGQWKAASRADSKHEPVANHPSGKADRTASGWKSVQH